MFWTSQVPFLLSHSVRLFNDLFTHIILFIIFVFIINIAILSVFSRSVIFEFLVFLSIEYKTICYYFLH